MDKIISSKQYDYDGFVMWDVCLQDKNGSTYNTHITDAGMRVRCYVQDLVNKGYAEADLQHLIKLVREQDEDDY